MEHQDYFKFLKLYEIKRKNTEGLSDNEKTFLRLDLLDRDNNSCSFMIFGDKKDKVINLGLESLQDVIITYSVTFNNNWHVNFVDINLN